MSWSVLKSWLAIIFMVPPDLTVPGKTECVIHVFPSFVLTHIQIMLYFILHLQSGKLIMQANCTSENDSYHNNDQKTDLPECIYMYLIQTFHVLWSCVISASLLPSMLTQACADAEERYTRLLGERPTPTGAAGDSGEGDQMEEIPISTPDGNSNEQSPMEAGKQMTGLRSMVAIRGMMLMLIMMAW